LYPIVEILDPTLIEEIVGGYFFIKNSISVNWEIYKDYLGDALTLVFFYLAQHGTDEHPHVSTYA